MDTTDIIEGNDTFPTLDELASALHKALFCDLSPTGWHRASSCPYATAWGLLAFEFAQAEETAALYAGCLHYLLQNQQPNGAWARLLYEQLIMTPHAYVALRLVYERGTESEQHIFQPALLAGASFLHEI